MSEEIKTEEQPILEQVEETNSAGPQKFRSQYAMEFENLDEELSKVPLFMTDLPAEENDTLAAIQSLVFDGSPEGNSKHFLFLLHTHVASLEIAQNFREQGNDCFRAGKAKYKDAIAFYTKAIDTECKDESIIEACLANRAACNLELQNYGRVLNDCSKCLKINPKNVKALYRSAKALFALDKLVEAIDCCDHALSIDPENKPVKEIRDRTIKRKTIIDEKIRQQEERKERERKKKETLENALKVKEKQKTGIVFETDLYFLRNVKLKLKLSRKRLEKRQILNSTRRLKQSTGQYFSCILSIRKVIIFNHSMKPIHSKTTWKSCLNNLHLGIQNANTMLIM